MQSSSVQLLQSQQRRKTYRCPKLRNAHVALTTPKHLYLLKRNQAKLETLRVERNIVSNVDVRSDRMLTMLDRLNMTEYIPELELLVVASQKGTVALTRLLRVELDDGQQTCLFNNEVYLPVNGLQRHALYGKRDGLRR
ncbi:hypothetical protein BCR43DRAFT_498567 [Syncephalastrum racemosum]|uniref:Uncharacterized protein n=1 Tax=Syncephalastrum racemosum TaxID=13706 RepID=A0A1X2H158_SYNRA|nr:hypothetical protein BCR43DRAFT_498567 [Syncephalastrum racemosum]